MTVRTEPNHTALVTLTGEKSDGKRDDDLDDPPMADTSAARILDAAIHALRTEIMPQLGDDTTRIRFDQITRLLYGVSARLSRRADGLRQLLAAAAAEPAIAASSIPMDDVSLDALEQHRQHIEQTIADRIPDWLAAASENPDVINTLERIVQLEKDFFLSQDADIAAGSQVVYRGGRIESGEPATPGDEWPPIDDSTLATYLHGHLQRGDVSVENVRTIPGGFSKQTLFFTQLDESTATRTELVIRKDMPVPFIEKTVTNEFGLLQHLHALGFPVAKPLWLENDVTIFGGRFIVSDRVQGSSNSAQWAADPIRARNACRELAKVLATLHAYSPQQLGYASDIASASAGAMMEREIDHWTRLFRARSTEPMPLQELPLVWLRRNIPKQLYQRPARIVHGDAGFHNLMFDAEGGVAALLDWEFSGLGDSTQDICFVRLFVENLMDWQEFLDIYLAAGGVPPCQEAEFFFDLWSKTRNSIGCIDARTLFDTVMPQEVKFALAGHVFAPYLFIDQCESLIAHLKKGCA